MTVKDFELRGWKDISAFLECEKRAAKRRLKRRGLLSYDGITPVLSLEAYRISSLKNHTKQSKTR